MLFSDGTDGRVKMWVYGLTAGGFALIVLVIALSFLLWYVSREKRLSLNLYLEAALLFSSPK